MKKKILALMMAFALSIPVVPASDISVVEASGIENATEITYQYTFHFVTNGGSELADYTIRSDESEVWTLPNTTRTGYKFVGWYTNPELTQKFSLYDTDLTTVYPNYSTITLYAKWEAKTSEEKPTYTITYFLNGGSFADSNYPTSFQSGDSLILPVPVREGYTFDCWCTDEALTTVLGSSTPITDWVLYARWKSGSPSAYAITYVLNGGVNPDNAPTSMAYGTTTILPTPTKQGYRFVGWYFDAAFTKAWGSQPITGPFTVYAKWETEQTPSNPNKATAVVYVTNGGTNPADAMTSVPANGTFVPPTPTRYGYTFKGWYYDKECALYDCNSYFSTMFIGQSQQYGQVTLYAKWELATYQVRYHSNGGALEAPFTDTYTMLSGLGTLKTTTRKGYEFKGWYSDINFTNQVTNIGVGSTGDVDLYALWLYVGNPTSTTTDTPTTTPGSTTTVTIPAATNDQKSVSTNGKTKIVYSNIGNGVKNPNPTEINCGETIELESPQRANYKFLGWTNVDGNEITSVNSKDEAVIYVYAEWERIKLGTDLVVKNKKKCSLVLTWKFTKDAEGAEIQYSTSRNFKKAKTYTCKASKKKYTIKKLKKNKYYYVRFRQYAMDSTGKKCYGGWITTKKVKIWK